MKNCNAVNKTEYNKLQKNNCAALCDVKKI